MAANTIHGRPFVVTGATTYIPPTPSRPRSSLGGSATGKASTGTPRSGAALLSAAADRVNDADAMFVEGVDNLDDSDIANALPERVARNIGSMEAYISDMSTAMFAPRPPPLLRRTQSRPSVDLSVSPFMDVVTEEAAVIDDPASLDVGDTKEGVSELNSDGSVAFPVTNPRPQASLVFVVSLARVLQRRMAVAGAQESPRPIPVSLKARAALAVSDFTVGGVQLSYVSLRFQPWPQ